MVDVSKLGRRTWIRRTASGMLAVWAGLELGRGRQGWGISILQPGRNVAHAQGTEVLRVSIDFPRDPDAAPDSPTLNVAAYALVRGDEIAIVDSLVEGNAQTIANAIQAAGFGMENVRHLILTHFHPDHVGSAAALAEMAPQATIWAGELDARQITMPRTIQTVVDGDEVFGLQIVGTPGHTLGHISVFDPLASAVVTGDALFNIGGVIGGSPPAFTADTALADASVRKLGAMSFQRALVAHGIPIESGASAAIAQFAATLQAPPPVQPAPVAPPAPQPAAPPAPQPAPPATAPAGQAPGVQAPRVQMPR